MQVWRLTKQRYAKKLDGEGARIYGSRWNSIGKPVVYTASSLSLALLEQLVRLDPDEIPDDFVSVAIEIPDSISKAHIPFNEFPNNWLESEMASWFKKQGDTWLDQQKTVALVVPSIIINEEMNILLNPLHLDIKQIKIIEIKPFSFDMRLFN